MENKTDASEEILAQAKFILNTGRMVHERVMRILSRMGRFEDDKSGSGDLSYAQVGALIAVKKSGTTSMGEIARRMGVSPSSASAMVDRLVEKRLLIRETDPDDRRRVLVRISPNTQRELTDMQSRLFRSFVQMVERLGPDTTRKWCEVLEKVKAVLEKMPEE